MRLFQSTVLALAWNFGLAAPIDDEYHQPSSKLSWTAEDEHREHRHRMHRQLIVEKGVKLNPDYDKERKLISLDQDLHPNELRKLAQRVEAKKEARALKKNDLDQLKEDDLSYWQRFLQTSGSIETDAPVASPTEPAVPTIMPVEESPRTEAPTTIGSEAPSLLPSDLGTVDNNPTVPTAPAPVPVPAPVMVPAPIMVPAPVVVPTPTLPTPAANPVPVPTAPVVVPTAPVPAPTIVAVPTLAPVIAAVPTATPQVEGRCREIITPVALFGGEEFTDPASYQSKALDWLCGPESTAYENDDAKMIQRYSLACIYFATYNVSTAFTDALLGNGTVLPWNIARDWLSATDECTWSNTQCDQTTTGSVVRLDFFANFMSGEFPPEVSYLKASLANIDLGRNPVFTRGEVFNSWLGTLTQLTSLRYEDTNFINDNGVPTEIGLLTNLEFYECTNVRYVGSISSAAFPATLTKLAYIEMEYNTFESAIPTEIGLLPSLEFFYARGSSITGNIDFMQGAVKLRECWTDDNPGITGTLPTFFGALTSLGGLSVTNCNWSGPLPTELGSLSASLQQLFFYGNSITGGIPIEYAGLTALTQLRVEDNLLTTQIPTEVCLLKITGGLNLQADCEICPFNCCSNC